MRVNQDVLRRAARGRPPRLLTLAALAMLFFALGSSAVSPWAEHRSGKVTWQVFDLTLNSKLAIHPVLFPVLLPDGT